jgi:hypothetical protein
MGGIHDIFQTEANRQHHFRINAVDGTAQIAPCGVSLASAYVARHALAKSAMSRNWRGQKMNNTALRTRLTR